MPHVELKSLSKIFGDRRVVESIDLVVEDGELLVLVGPSGCGKTTTLRLIAGLEQATSGEIRIGDRNVNGVRPKDRNVAMVFQDYALYPHMTVAKNLAYGLKVRRVDSREIERRVREAAEVLDLTRLLDRKPARLSGGEQQRVALGRAIVRDPDVFLLDEPLSNLDARMRDTMRRELSRLHQRLQATMIHVTHDQVEAMMLGDRVAVMNDGRIHQVGTPLEIYRNPANQFVAGFIGSPPMNFLSGRVELRGGLSRVVFESVSLDVPVPAEVDDGSLLTVGVRPEDVRLSVLADESVGTSVGESASVDRSGKVMRSHVLGPETHVEVSYGSHELTCRTGGDRIWQPGQAVTVAIEEARCHLFDEHGQRIATRS